MRTTHTLNSHRTHDKAVAARAARNVMAEPLERRTLMSAATDATGFYPPVALSGETSVTLYPVESVAAGQSVKVSFGVPFPRGFVPLGDLTKVKVLDAGGAERALSVQLLTPWRDLMNLVDENSVRSALVQLNVSFPDADGDGDADPVQLRLAWGGANRSPADLAPVDPRTTWVAANDASYPASAGVLEPNAYAAFSPDWYGQSLLKTRTQAMGSDGDFAAYEGAFENFARTAVNDVDPRVTAGNRINYLTGDGEPWLYDRSTALYQLAFRTGEFRWLREAHRSSQFYANSVNARGYFAPQDDDMKYSYGESIAIDYWLTGDARLLDVHRRIITPFDRDFTAAYTPGRIWTERSASGKMLAYVTGYELLGEVAQGQKAKDVFNVYLNHQANPPAGAANTGLLMHRSEDHIEGGQEWVASPWMTSLLVDTALRYYVHSGDTRVEQFVTRIADGMNRLGESIYYHDYQGHSYLASFYLAGPGLTEDQHQADFFADKEHAIDVSRVFALAYYFSRKARAPNAAYLGRFNEMMETATFNFGYWTRPAGPESGNTVYRVTPPRKFNWWFKNTADIDFLVGSDFNPGADSSPPTATPVLTNVTTSGATSYTFSVMYSDNRGVDVSSLGTGDVQVRGPGGVLITPQLVSVNSSTNGTPRSATYQFVPPGGSWDAADNGTYDVNLLAGQVADTSGNFAPASMLNRFTVQANPADAAAPTAAAAAHNVNAAGGAAHTFTVTYADNVAVNVASMGTGDVVVTGPGGYSQVAAFVSVDNVANGTPRTATYRITPPGGSWDAADNGAYTVSLTGGQVTDTSGNSAAAGGVGSFAVAVAPPNPDAPTATASGSEIANGGAGYHYFTVNYADNVALDWRTITTGDIEVTGPNGFSQVAYLANFPSGQDPKNYTVTYRVSAPGGSWGNKDNGLFEIRVRPAEVADTSGSFVAAGVVGTFRVAISDATAPAVTVHASDVASGGGSYHYFTVTYADAVGVDWRSIGTGDIEVVGANGFAQPAVLANLPANQNPTRMTATYRVSAPGGAWVNKDNGSYSVRVRPSEVSDLAGNFVPAGTVGTFSVAITDFAAPAATSSASDVTYGGNYHYFTVSYVDNVGVNYKTINAGDVQVTGPNGFAQTAFLANLPANHDPANLDVTYRITAPGAGWDYRSNGTYTITLMANQVFDLSGNPATAGTLANFRVALPVPPPEPGKAAPVVESFSTNAAVIGAISEGQAAAVSATFSDLDAGDAHSMLIDWGDGTVTHGDLAAGATTLGASHAYTAGGAYTVKLTVSDAAGYVGTSTVQVFVTGAGVRDGVLQIVGTAAADRILVTPSADQILVTAGFVAGGRRAFPAGGITRVVLLSGEGNDYLSLYDTIAARGVLVGGDGDDTLFGGQSSLLIGGKGADRINGAGGDDIIVAGTTCVDGDVQGLLAVLGGTRPLVAADCADDGASDVLNGSKGTDRFIAHCSGSGPLDSFDDLYHKSDEQVIEV